MWEAWSGEQEVPGDRLSCMHTAVRVSRLHFSKSECFTKPENSNTIIESKQAEFQMDSPSLLTHCACGICVPGPHSLLLSGRHSSSFTTSHSKQLGSSHGMASTRWGQFPVPPVGSLMIFLFLSLKPVMEQEASTRRRRRCSALI